MSVVAQSVQRAISVLRAFDDAEPQLSLTSLAARTGLPVSTAYRLAKVLVDNGLLERVGDDYRVGLGLVALAAPALQRMHVQTLAPHLYSLADSIEITASLGVADRTEVLTVLSARPVRRFCGHQLPGRRQPLARSAMGLAVLAFTHRHGGAGDQRLELVRRRGYAEGDGGGQVRAVAVPVLGPDGDAWGAVGVQALRRRLTDELVREILPVMHRHARQMPQPAAR